LHRELGPRLPESAYQKALAREVTLRSIRFEGQKLSPVRYKNLVIEDAYCDPFSILPFR
jgi:GxxExxY protein